MGASSNLKPVGAPVKGATGLTGAVVASLPINRRGALAGVSAAASVDFGWALVTGVLVVASAWDGVSTATVEGAEGAATGGAVGACGMLAVGANEAGCAALGCAGAGASTGCGCGAVAAAGITVGRTDVKAEAGAALLVTAVADCGVCAHATGKAHIDQQKTVRATRGFKRYFCFTAASIRYIKCVETQSLIGGRPAEVRRALRLRIFSRLAASRRAFSASTELSVAGATLGAAIGKLLLARGGGLSPTL